MYPTKCIVLLRVWSNLRSCAAALRGGEASKAVRPSVTVQRGFFEFAIVLPAFARTLLKLVPSDWGAQEVGHVLNEGLFAAGVTFEVCDLGK